MSRYSTNTYDDPDLPRMPWWGWILVVLTISGLGALVQWCGGGQ